MPEISSYIEPAVAGYMKEAIREAGGNEVFFLGSVGEDRRVVRAAIVARGDESSVPAIAQGAAVGDVVIHNHPTGELTPSGPDLDVAAMLGSRGVGFFIVDNSLTGIYAVVEPFAREVLRPVDEEEVKAALTYTGALSSVMDGFEHRQGQVDMALEVTRAFNQGKVAALEAGTGIGKSMAYLVPALLWIRGNKERVVVSTNTINLQEQLIAKDIPLLGRAFPEPFKAVLVKGRGNYVCLRKLDQHAGEGELLFDERDKDALQAVAEWARNTKEGSRSDLNFVPGEDLWDGIKSDSDTCTRLKCPHFSRCFFFRARREAASADILVVNHHILLADIALRSSAGGTSEMAILPGYTRLVIDEGHNLEDGATSYFGSRVSRLGVLKALGRLHHKRERDKGLLPYLVKTLAGGKAAGPRAQAWRTLMETKILPEKESAAAGVEEAFDALYGFAQGLGRAGEEEVKLRLKDEVREKPGWPEVERAFAGLCEDLSRLARSVASLCKQIEVETGGDGATPERLASPMVELRALSERFQDTASAIDLIIRGDGDGMVRWVEAPARKAGRVISVCASPLNVAREIKERVYDRMRTVIVTSATLTVRHRFDFLKKRIGLGLVPEDRLVTGIFPSPFDYARQVVIGIPTDIPQPTEGSFGRVLTELVRESLEVTKGRAFVLFTSFVMMNAVYKDVRLDMASEGIKGLKQGDAPRHKLLEDFRKNPSSVLFGTDSFWEGVDVAGEALSNVIITKLPFSVPDDPVIEARQEEIKASGGNPFMEYIVPQAVIKFRQGFGRLIRRKSDRGCIMIFDRRVVDKNYGEQFLSSLPEGRVVTGRRDAVFERVHEFFTPEMF